MACKECLERREKIVSAVLEGRLAEAVKQTAIGAAELAGLKDKDPTIETADLAGAGEGIQLDAGDPPADPVKSRKRG